MPTVTMNIRAITWRSKIFQADSLALLDFDVGGDVVEHSAGTDIAVSSSQIANIKALVSIGFDSREDAVILAALIDNVEGVLVLFLKDLDAATGLRFTIDNAKLQRVRSNAAHNSPTNYTAVFYGRSTDGQLSPVTLAAGAPV